MSPNKYRAGDMPALFLFKCIWINGNRASPAERHHIQLPQDSHLRMPVTSFSTLEFSVRAPQFSPLKLVGRTNTPGRTHNSEFLTDEAGEQSLCPPQ